MMFSKNNSLLSCEGLRASAAFGRGHAEASGDPL